MNKNICPAYQFYVYLKAGVYLKLPKDLIKITAWNILSTAKSTTYKKAHDR
jgi:hypothetical protein